MNNHSEEISGLFRRNIWIIGSSIIAKAEKHTTQRPTGKNLALDKNGLNVVWAGLPGMKISALVPLVQAMVNCFGLPHALVIHCGGNDIGMGSIREVLKHLIYATFIVSKMLPNSLLIYSQILPRTKWRYNSNLKAMERARKRINRGIRTYYYKSNAKVITHADLQDGHNALFADDGVHLSFLGNDIFINAIQCGLEQFALPC